MMRAFLYSSLLLPVIGIALIVSGARHKPPFGSWQRIAIWTSLALPALEVIFFRVGGTRLHRASFSFALLAIPPVLSLILAFGLLLGSREGQGKWLAGFLLLVGPLAFLALLGAQMFSYAD